MRDRDLYAQILGITSPWHVSDVRLDVPAGKVEVIVEHRGQACCPQCGKSCPGYDSRPLQGRLRTRGPDGGWIITLGR
jgi:transposase